MCLQEKEDKAFLDPESDVCILCFEKIQKHCIEADIKTPEGVYADVCEALKIAKKAITDTLSFELTEKKMCEDSLFSVVFSSIFEELRRIREEMNPESEDNERS